MEKLKILIVEDDDIMRRALEFRLMKENHEVICTDRSRSALELLRSGEFDLVISDTMTPFINGQEVLNVIRHELKSETPVILLAPVGSEKFLLEAFELGANDFITWPFSPGEMMLRMSRIFLTKKRSSGQ